MFGKLKDLIKQKAGVCKLIKQILKFLVVGVIAAIIDVGFLVILKEWLHIDVLISSAVSFSISVAVNYILSMAFVFEGKKQNRIKEFIIFVLLSLGGLLINELIIWIGINCTNLHYLIVKFLAMVIVPFYNFTTRKIFLESKEK